MAQVPLGEGQTVDQSSFANDFHVTFQIFSITSVFRYLMEKIYLHYVIDLHPDYLYWVQKDKVVEKKKFLDKYTHYT